MNILLLGFGLSGKSVYNLLVKHGHNVTIFDDEFCDVNFYARLLYRYNLIVASPGISPSHKILITAKRLKIKIVSEIEVAYSYLLDNKLIGVTGTNGKTTITGMIGCVLGKDSILCGNIGTPLSSFTDKTNCNLIIELSSFQLNYIDKFKLNIAVLSNIRYDHITWHGSFENYIKSKLNIFKNLKSDDYAIINVEDEISNSIINKLECKVIKYGFGLDSGNYCTIVNNEIIYCIDGKKERLFDINNFNFIGNHNYLNMLVAVIVGKLFGVKNDSILKRIKKYRFERFRLEKIPNSNFEVINDSKSTNVASCEVAIKAFKTKQIVLVLGGIDKNEPLDTLFDNQNTNVKHFVFYGRSKIKFEKVAKQHKVTSYYVANDFFDAICNAYNNTCKDEVLLFSPACASFDMFGSYYERGEKFSAIIKLLNYNRNGIK